MSKKLKIIIAVILVVLVSTGALAVWQRDNIQSLIYYVKYSEEDLSEILDENKKEINSAISKANGIMPRELEEEEIQALEKNEISEDDAVEISLGIVTLAEKLEQIRTESENTAIADKNQNDSDDKNAESGNVKNGNSENGKGNIDGSSGDKNTYNKNNGNDKNNAKDDLNDQNSKSKTLEALEKEDAVSVLVAKFYVLKASYVSKLNALESAGIAEYKNTEVKNAAWKASMISKYTGKVSALESECDAKFEALVSELKKAVAESGSDDSIVKKVRSAYESEKQVKKASYLNSYLN